MTYVGVTFILNLAIFRGGGGESWGIPVCPPSSVLIPAGAYIVFWIINTCFVDCRSLIDCYQVASTEIKGKSASYIFFFHYLYPIMSVTVLLNVCMICLK